MSDMITAGMLIAFADANGLRIMSHRDPEKWAEKINKNNGLCPCGKECPCDDCTCLFYEKTLGSEGITKPEPVKEPAQEPMNNDELKKTIAVLEETKNLLTAVNAENENDADDTERLSKISEMIEKNAKEHECGLCASMVGGLHRKIKFLGEECRKDSASCAFERDATIIRVEQMTEIFKNADKELSEEKTSDEIEEPEIEEETMKETDSAWTRPVESSVGFSDFHDCVAKNVESMQDVKRSDRICVAAKMCGRKRMPKEDAITDCMDSD